MPKSVDRPIRLNRREWPTAVCFFLRLQHGKSLMGKLADGIKQWKRCVCRACRTHMKDTYGDEQQEHTHT